MVNLIVWSLMSDIVELNSESSNGFHYWLLLFVDPILVDIVSITFTKDMFSIGMPDFKSKAIICRISIDVI